jgi:hypothetical protein
MPNVENIKKAIAVMERVKSYEELHGRKFLNMLYFQRNTDNIYKSTRRTEEEVTKEDCGTVCCLAGWMAISPEFRDQIQPNSYGGPEFNNQVFRNETPASVIAHLFEIEKYLAYALIHPHSQFHPSSVWNVTEEQAEKITPDQVIEKLKALLD